MLENKVYNGENCKPKNTGLKVMIVILLFCCFSLSNNISDLNNQINNLEYDIEDLEDSLWEMQDEMYALHDMDDENMDAGWHISEMDWNKKQMKVEFEIYPEYITDNTTMKIINSDGEATLEKKGDAFIGSVWYPISYDADTEVVLCEGKEEIDRYIISEIRFDEWAYDQAACYINGYEHYGNGKYTLSGTVDYAIPITEEIEKASFVIGEKSIEIDKTIKGSFDVEASESVNEKAIKNGKYSLSDIYVELEDVNGVKYRVYPAIDCYSEYTVTAEVGEGYSSIGPKEETAENYDDYLYQDSVVIVILPDGTQYESYATED